MLIYVTGKARFHVFISKISVLKRNIGRVEFLIQKQNRDFDAKNGSQRIAT